MRKGVSARASDGALLQRGVSAESETVVAMEEPATMAAVGERAEEAEATKAFVIENGWGCWTWNIAPGKCGAWVINKPHQLNFFSNTCDRPGC